MRRIVAGALALASLVVMASCGQDTAVETTTTTTTAATSTSSTNPAGPLPGMKLTPIATLDQPTSMAQRDGDTTIYLTERAGRVRAVRSGIVDPLPILDITSQVGSEGGEQGLLGIAFAPGSSKFYVNFTDKSGDTHIVEFALGDNGVTDLHSQRELLFVDQPYPNHNGGQMTFGPDRMLYIGLGDGGSKGDPQKNAQNLTVVLGKILRIDPKPSNDKPYTIPFDNPFAKQEGARGEIWSYGLRNPWRFSFDAAGGMWIGDVGQDAVEEIDYAPKGKQSGANYGWALREGTHKFSGEKPTAGVDPVYEYTRQGGACSVTGGYVYNGSVMSDMTARYVYGDYCTGEVSVLTKRGDSWQSDKTSMKVDQLASFGRDQQGELYTISLTGALSKIEPS